MVSHRDPGKTPTEGVRRDGPGARADGALWIVATPIGTLADLSPRAAEVLSAADLVLAEDTRRLRRLASGLGLDLRGGIRSFHEHNEDRVIEDVLALLRKGADVALVSDAGTPVLSDPGYGLVDRARREGLRVSSVPGPSAFTAALAAAGQPPLPATLVGFLPPRTGARRKRLASLEGAPGSVVLFMSPHRLARELADAADILGAERPATLLAEISKLHERAEVGTLEELAAGREAGAPRGEYVLVVGPPVTSRKATGIVGCDEARAAFEAALEERADRREARRAAARSLGISRRELYSLLVEDSETET